LLKKYVGGPGKDLVLFPYDAKTGIQSRIKRLETKAAFTGGID